MHGSKFFAMQIRHWILFHWSHIPDFYLLNCKPNLDLGVSAFGHVQNFHGLAPAGCLGVIIKESGGIALWNG
jgi:hypothetical protein